MSKAMWIMKIRNSWLVLIAIVALAICGCNILTDVDTRNDLAAELAIKYATLKTIERSGDPSAKAARIAEIAGQAKILVDKGTVALVPELESIVRSKIPWSDLDAADTILADALLTTVRSELMSRVDGGTIDDTSRVAVAMVLDLIIQSTKLFTG